jgi:hypothetical protein
MAAGRTFRRPFFCHSSQRRFFAAEEDGEPAQARTLIRRQVLTMLNEEIHDVLTPSKRDHHDRWADFDLRPPRFRRSGRR